jgi:hypothetical protein
MKVTETFRGAEALADFANLNPADAASVAYFRNNYPEFAPSEWWDYPCRMHGMRVIRAEDALKIQNDRDYDAKLKKLQMGLQQWEYTQDHIQTVWKGGFKLSVSGVSELLKLVFCVDRPGLVWNSSQVFLPNGSIYELNTKLYDFHKAVLYLHQHPNQAKICKNEKCRKYFVHVHGKREFCEYPDARGETCRHKNDNKRRLEYYYQTGKKERQAKTRKSSPRVPGSRRKKAARKR